MPSSLNFVFVFLCLCGAQLNVAAAAAAENASCSIVPSLPDAVSPRLLQAAAATDSTVVLQEQLDGLHPYESARLAPGTYRINKALILRIDGVQLHGLGATLVSTNDREGGLTIQANRVGVFDLTLDQTSRARQSTPWAGGIAIYKDKQGIVSRVFGTVLQHNMIKHAAAAGIFVYRATDFLIADNTVWRSLADGIHITAGSTNGRVLNNRVSQTGDDMIAVVSYAGDPSVASARERYKAWDKVQDAVNRNILIADNEVSDQYWGRGISVVGGMQITVLDNQISRSPMAAGIYLVREASFRSYGIHDVLVRGNEIRRIQTDAPSYQPHPAAVQLTGHGAIEIGSLQDPEELTNNKYRAAFSVDRIAIIDNDIDQARFAGIRIGVGAAETVSDVLVQGNDLSGVSQRFALEFGEGLKPNGARCLRNRLNGVNWPSGCGRTVRSVAHEGAAVRGFSARCNSEGDVITSPLPHTPTGQSRLERP